MADKLTAERLRELLHYNQGTGIFTWRVQNSARIKVGAVAGSPHARGYSEIGVDGRSHLAHRLVWLYMTGEWPKQQIDHRDGCRTNNAWANLRDVDRRTNAENMRQAKSNNLSGFLGVCTTDKRFTARISAGKGQRPVILGRFDTPEEAHAAYLTAKRRLHVGCTI